MPHSFTVRAGTFLALLAQLLIPDALHAHKETVHQYLALEGYRLLLDRYPSISSTAMARRIGAAEEDCGGFPFTAATVTAGAYREDCEDPVYGYGDVAGPLDDAYFSASHFWDADAGDNSTITICDISCGSYQNAFRKSLRYVLPGLYGRWTAKLTWPAGIARFTLQGGGIGSIFHNGQIGFEYDSLIQFYRDGRASITGFLDVAGRWQTSSTVPDQLPLRIVAPQDVRDRIAWEVIGRIVHLLGDMGVPAHAHNDIHPPFWWGDNRTDVFEEEMGRRHSGWGWREAAGQGHLLELPGWSQGAPAENVLRYLLYTTNQVADRFPSNDADGDAFYARSWGDDDYSVLDLLADVTADPTARNVFQPEAADYAFVFSIRSIAGLLGWFAHEAGLLSRISVGSSPAAAVLTVDGKPRTAPYAFTTLPGSVVTLEAADQPAPAGDGASLRFDGWTRSAPGAAPAWIPLRRVQEPAAAGASYIAKFSAVYAVRLDPPRHLDGGGGGSYSVNGADVGGAWNGAVDAGASGATAVGFHAPPGAVFLAWEDGVRDNPRLLQPRGALTLRALVKRRLATVSPPPNPLSGGRRLARSAGGSPAVFVYESAGDVFLCENRNGEGWSNEELVSAGLGAARDPAVDCVDGGAEGGSAVLVVWEERVPETGGYRIVRRQRDAAGWSPATTLYAEAGRRPDRAYPVVSGGTVAWRGADAIMVIATPASLPGKVPGTDGGSGAPLLDRYADTGPSGGGGFAIAWHQPGSGILFRRWGAPPSGWSPLLIVAPTVQGIAAPPADLAANETGAACIAWTIPVEGGWRTEYRVVESNDQMQPAGTLGLCPLQGGTAPRPMAAHFRRSSAAVRDLAVYAWNGSTGALRSAVIRSGPWSGPAAIPITGTDPEVPKAASGSAPPLLSYAAESGGVRTLHVGTLPATPGIPGSAVPLAPAHGFASAGASVVLRWACGDDADSYEVQVGRTAAFTPPLVAHQAAVRGSTLAVGGLSPATAYVWRVRAVNSSGPGRYSAPVSFSTSAAPEPPALSGSVLVSGAARHPRLTWTPAAGASSYRLSRRTCVEECDPSAGQSAVVYDGPGTAHTDASVMVAAKSSSSRVEYTVTSRTDGFSSGPSNVVSFAAAGDVVWGGPAAEGAVPSGSGLDANFPNPFNPSTTIPFRAAVPGSATIAVYDVLGRIVAVLHEGPVGPGFHRVRWDAAGLPAGVYFATFELVAGDGGGLHRERRKLLLLR